MKNELLVTDIADEFSQTNTVEKLEDFTRKSAREVALLGCETSDIVHDGFPVRFLGMILSSGMLNSWRKMISMKGTDKVESWEEAGSIESFNHVDANCFGTTYENW